MCQHLINLKVNIKNFKNSKTILKQVLLQIDKIDRDRLAVIDSDGNKLTYGEIVDLANQLRAQLPHRALCFMLVENTAECAKWVMAALASKQLVPLILNLKTEKNYLVHLGLRA